MKALVFSPHFDDAVLSCAAWLEHHPGTVVATVCSGRPGPGVPADPTWDALAGFVEADHAAEARGAEDREALDVLGARPRGLGFLDGGYKAQVGRPHEETGGPSSFDRALTEAVDRLLEDVRPITVLFPLGLVHPDHVATRRAVLACLRGRPELPALAYLDLPYGMAFGEVAHRTIDSLRAAGVDLGDPVPGGDGPAKARAAGCYRSQLPLLANVFGERLHASLDPRAERLLTVRPSDRAS
ncbi:MAG TPA: PIG-L family deacetylase [Acidimicrobiales bacterium]|jgi:LmbE family N-acetylglucosaminyl deacetylase|nr:PIG-L family deacetylase [Acidimicrobiales bacterium]